MRCIGRTRKMRRCGNSARFLVCHHHRYQLWTALFSVVGAFGLLAGIYQDAWKPFFHGEQPPSSIHEPTTISSQGDHSPVLNAGRDAVVGAGAIRPVEERASSPPEPPADTSNTPRATTPRMSSTGDHSPVLNAGRDAIVNVIGPKADYITDHDGAGALLMTEPDFRAFLSHTMGRSDEKVIGRLVNGTEVAKIELKEADMSEPNPPWVKVKVLEGDLKDSEGWILMNALRKP